MEFVCQLGAWSNALIVSGRQRQPFRRSGWTARTVFATLTLAVSSTTIAYQDALARFPQYADVTSRWQLQILLDKAAGNARVARVFPDVQRRIMQGELDATTTASLPPAASVEATTVAAVVPPTINRGIKGDRLKTDLDLSAGTLVVASLFAIPSATEISLGGGFVAPAKAVVASAPAPKKIPGAVAVPPIPVSAPAPELLAYATGGNATIDSTPFDAVMGSKSIVLDPNIDDNHAWLNTAIPASARSATEIKCLATAIYFEARGEPQSGQVAVAQVVINRLKNPAYPSTICSVVYQNKNMRRRCQFSFACDGIPDRINDKPAWQASLTLARRIVNDDTNLYMASVGAATHYHATYVKPRWARSMKRVDKIGRHVFYKTRNCGWS